jgi:N-acetylglucosaminyl-diphospho-decaprenol L-rhamnosyltransferase
VDDLAIIVVSTNEAHWLGPCLSSIFERSGNLVLDVIVADNHSTDGTAELVEREFPQARVVPCANHGFAHANNRALMTCDARYVLFLNPDTEILEGSFEDLVRTLDASPTVGLAGVKQLTADGALSPTIRRFPTALRALAEALGSERLPIRFSWLGERELDLQVYERQYDCDWTSGSFMLARREALESGGYLDERFFIYSEEPDLCLRLKRAGWRTVHLPSMTIVHHAGKAGVSPKMAAQDAVARRQYAAKHFGKLHRGSYIGALLIRYGLRSIIPGARSKAARTALRALLGVERPPFGPPPATGLRPRGTVTVERKA